MNGSLGPKHPAVSVGEGLLKAACARSCAVLVLRPGSEAEIDDILTALALQKDWHSEQGAVIVWQPASGLPEAPAPPREAHTALAPPGFRELGDGERLECGGRYFAPAHQRVWFQGTRVRVGSFVPGEHRPIDRLLLSLGEGWGSASVAVLATPADDGETGLRIIRAVGGITLQQAVAAPPPLEAPPRSAGAAQAVAPAAPGQSTDLRRERGGARVFSIPAHRLGAARAACEDVVAAARDGERVRVWVPGCKTGGHTYAIAMLLRDVAARWTPSRPMLVFGTDADQEALAVARTGRYPARAALGMDPELRGRYTFDEGDTIRVSEAVRHLCVFVRQDFRTDVPMARVDLLVSYRMFDGLDEAERDALVDAFHYSLRDGGVLLALDHVDLFPETRFEAQAGGYLRARPLTRRVLPEAGSPKSVLPAVRPPKKLPPTSPGENAPLAPAWPLAPLSFSRGRLDTLLQGIGLPLIACDERLCLIFANAEARTAFALPSVPLGAELVAIARRLPGGLDLVPAARRALIHRDSRELVIASRQHTYLARISADAGVDGASVSIAFTDVTQLEVVKARAVAQQHRQTAIVRLSELALGPAEPAALYEEALAALFGNVHACTAGIIIEQRGPAGAREVVGSRGLGLDPLGTLARMADAASLLDAVVERACIVSQGGDRAAWGGRSKPSGLARKHPRAHSVARGIGCPIIVEGKVLGVIALYGRHTGVDDPEHQPFLQAVANLLGGAMVRQRTRRRLALELEVSRVLAAATSPNVAYAGLQRALAAALAVDDIELWASSGGSRAAALSGEPAAGDMCAGAAVRLWSSVEQSRPVPSVSLRVLLGSSAADAPLPPGQPGELCIPLERPGERRCVLVLRGARLCEPDPELSEGLASVGRMLSAFLERLQFLAKIQHSEASFRQKSAELEALYASLPVGISIHDFQGKLRHHNRFLAALDPAGPDATAHPLARLYSEEIPPWVARVLALDAPVHDVELFVCERDRIWSWLCNFAPIRDVDSRLHGVSVVVQDITELKRVEASLRQADHQKDDFLAMLGHELRNPIAALRSATELLGRIESASPRLSRLHGVFERQTQQATKLIDGLLDVARVARGKVELELVTVPLVQLVRDVIEDHRQQFKERSLECQLPADELWVQGDRARLMQILDNLLSNALRFTAKNGRIGIALTRLQGRGRMRVEDDGAGIEPELLPKIFEPFRQGRPKSAGQAGLGLGLALVKGLVELHGFELRAGSAGRGRGASFEIEFPLVAAPDSPAPPSRFDMRALDLLLVEDNPDIAETLSELLIAAGHRVQWTGTAEEALVALHERRPDVVLSDIGLPGMSGLELASQVRADPALAAVKLVAMTGYGDAATQAHIVRAGFQRALIKPVQLEALRHCLARVAAVERGRELDDAAPISSG